MSGHHVTVHQLASDKTYLNVDSGQGHVGVWGCSYKSPTYLCLNGIRFEIIQFDSQEWADEWIEENKQYWKTIEEIMPRNK